MQFLMNFLNLFSRLYARLHNYPGVPFWVLTPLRKIVRYGANRILPRYLEKAHTHRGTIENGVIISFTSFPARINDVWKVVESLKNQSILPEKIILWLSNEQFPSRESIPESLWKEEDGLFEIRMVDGDIRSHKKFYYVMQEYPDKSFVTCDDDIYYHPDMLRCLVEGGKQFPGCIIANTTRKICFDGEGSMMPYKTWEVNQKSFASDNLIQIGVGGVLYPPKTLHELTLRKDLFLSLTPMADDIWLNCMARMQGTPVVRSAMKILPLPIDSDSPSLSSVNKEQNRNDVQLSQLKDYLVKNGLPDVYSATFKITPPKPHPIVSLTSFPARINTLWQVVECMMRQTYQPAKIILWLSKEQFPDGSGIPASLKDREGDIFEIRIVEGDIRSHKKYHYVSKEYPDSLVFLIDDDIYYPTDILERTMETHQNHPEAVICNYGYHMRYNDKGELVPYNEWPIEHSYSMDDDLFFGSGGGTLFKPSWLYKDLTNIELALKLTPIADDIWLNAMVSMVGCEKILLPNGKILPVFIKEDVKLATQNKEQNGNDKQLHGIITHYKNLWSDTAVTLTN